MPQHQGFGRLTLIGEHGVESSGIGESPFGLHLQAKDPGGIAIDFFVAAQG